MKPKPGIRFLVSDDLVDEGRNFLSFLAMIFSFETLPPSALEILDPLRVLNGKKAKAEETSSSRFITKKSFRKYHRSHSEDLNEPKSFSNYLCSLRKIKTDLLLNVAVRFWANEAAFFTPSNFTPQREIWKAFFEFLREFLDIQSLVVTKNVVISLICGSQKLQEQSKTKCKSLSGLITELVIALKKYGRIIHTLSLRIKTDEKTKALAPSLEISSFTQNYYERSQEFEKMLKNPHPKRKDHLTHYYKWKLRNWREEVQRNRLRSLKEIQIRCKICLKDIPCSIFKEHSEYCKEKGVLTAKLSKMRKEANKFANLFQEIRIFLLTKTKMDIKNLRNLKSRFELSSHTLLLKSQTIVPLDSMRFIDLESVPHDNESVDDGCSLDSLEPVHLRKSSSTKPDNEVHVLQMIRASKSTIKESIRETESRNLSPNFNSSSSQSNARSPNMRSLQELHLSKLSDFAKKRGINTSERRVEDSTKFSPGIKESKFKALRKIEATREEELCLDEIEESELVRKKTQEEQKTKPSGVATQKDNLLEEILKRNYLQKQQKTSENLQIITSNKPKIESLCEFDSDANFNSSLPSENSSPKLSPAMLELGGIRKGSFSSEIDPIYEKPSCENTPFTDRSSKPMCESVRLKDLQLRTEKSLNPPKKEEKISVSSDYLGENAKNEVMNRDFFDENAKNEVKNLDFLDENAKNEVKNRDFEQSLLEKHSQEKLQGKFMSDSEESIYGDEESKEAFDSKEKFSLRNRTRTLMVIGSKDKEKSLELKKHKNFTELVTAESLNPMERAKAQKDIYKLQKKLIKKNDDGIQSCSLFSELFTYISENEYVERLGYKIQKTIFKLEEISQLLPEKKKEDKERISDSREFLEAYQQAGERLQRFLLLLYKLHSGSLKGADNKQLRENVRNAFITRGKKQNSDSVDVAKRSRYEKNPVPKSKISQAISLKESMQSGSALSCSKSGQTTPGKSMFMFSEVARPESSLTSKNLAKLLRKDSFTKQTPSRTTSQISIQHNLTSLHLVPDLDLNNDKNPAIETLPRKKTMVSFGETPAPNRSSIQNLPKTVDFPGFQSSPQINETLGTENREDSIVGDNNFQRRKKRTKTFGDIARTKTFNEIEVKGRGVVFHPILKFKDGKSNPPNSKYMAVLNLFKRSNKLDNPNRPQLNRKHKRKFGVRKSVLQTVLRRSSVDVLSPLTSPDSVVKPAGQKKKRPMIFSAGNSPEIRPKEDLLPLNLKEEENKTQNTIFTTMSKIELNVPSKNELPIQSQPSKQTILEKIDKGQIESSSSDSQDESFALREEDYFRGYYSDSYMPSQHVSAIDIIDKKEKKTIGIENFEFINLIGKGAFGRVYLVRRKQTGDQYAMKIINTMDNMNKNKSLSLKTESKVFDLVYSDFVVKALFKFSHEKFYCFVMEYMYGGDFNKILQKYQSLDNHTTQFYIAELVLAVEHLHNLGIVHRDLKPDNILLDVKGHIKLTDFGLSEVAIATLSKHKQTPVLSREEKFRSLIEKLKINEDYFIDPHINYKLDMIKSQVEAKQRIPESPDTSPTNPRRSIKKANKNMHRIIGTPDYIAPEVINGTGSLNHPCIDWWSVGVILFEFLTGIPPFNDDTPEKIFENITNLRVDWDQLVIGYEEDQMTPEASDLIKRLLELDPEKRLGSRGVEEIKNHDFFKGIDWNNLIKSEPPIIPEIIQEEEKKANHKITEKDPFLMQVVAIQGAKKVEEKRRFFEEEEEDSQIRYDLLDKQNQITLENLKMDEKTLKEENSSSVSISVKEKDGN